MLFLLACAWALWHGSFKPFGYFVTSVITPLWHAAILARGINAIYEFDERLKTLVFFIAYLWTTMLGMLWIYDKQLVFRPLQMILTAAEWIYLNF